MPSRSMKEHRFWEWVEHNPEAAKREGVQAKPSVAHEFVQADKGHDLSKLPTRVTAK
jgi:hypothetical protein